MMMVKEWGHSVSSQSWKSCVSNEEKIMSWAKWGSVSQPHGVPWLFESHYLSDVDCSRNCAPEAPVPFREKLSQHEPCTLRDVKADNVHVSRWPRTDTPISFLTPVPGQSLLCITKGMPDTQEMGIFACISALCLPNVSLLCFLSCRWSQQGEAKAFTGERF